jgi:hypothetical protein
MSGSRPETSMTGFVGAESAEVTPVGYTAPPPVLIRFLVDASVT